jgi:hypothetical protein
MRTYGIPNALIRVLTKGGCEGQEVMQSEAHAEEASQLRLDEHGFTHS